MSSETSPEPSEPTDESWAKLQNLIAAARDIGITDTAYVREVLETTSNEEIRAKALELIQEASGTVRWALDLISRIDDLLGGREAVAEQQYRAEMALLHRIERLSEEAQAEDLYALAASYAQLRSYSVAPGWYAPDVRHSRDVRHSGGTADSGAQPPAAE